MPNSGPRSTWTQRKFKRFSCQNRTELSSFFLFALVNDTTFLQKKIGQNAKFFHGYISIFLYYYSYSFFTPLCTPVQKQTLSPLPLKNRLLFLRNVPFLASDLKILSVKLVKILPGISKHSSCFAQKRTRNLHTPGSASSLTHTDFLYTACSHSASRNPTFTNESPTRIGRFTSIPSVASRASCSSSLMPGSFSFKFIAL